MKKLVALLFLVSLFSIAFAQKTKLTVTYRFLNLVDGYDHNSKTEVWIDGKLVGTSKISKESEENSFTVKFPSGEHEINVINYAEYEGAFEPHTVENDYSIDCVYLAKRTFKKKEKLFMSFDIDNGAEFSWEKMPAPREMEK